MRNREVASQPEAWRLLNAAESDKGRLIEAALARVRAGKTPRDKLNAAAELMDPGGGSFETTAAVAALWRVLDALIDPEGGREYDGS